MNYYISYIKSKKYPEMESAILVEETYDTIDINTYKDVIDKVCKDHTKHLYVSEVLKVTEDAYKKIGKCNIAFALRVCQLHIADCKKERRKKVLKIFFNKLNFLKEGSR